MYRILPFVVGGCFLLLIGCGTTSKPEVEKAEFEKPKNAEKASSKEKEKAASGINAYALDRYQELGKKEKGNLIFSPASLATALGMTYGGAREETATEMARAMHFSLDQEKLHPALSGLLWDLHGAGKGVKYELSIANAIWSQKKYPFRAEFLQLGRDNYSAALETLDFEKDSEGSRKTINAWVEKKTRDKIKDLLPKGSIDEVTRMVLTNAVYFKGNWKTKFDPSKTGDGDFWTSKDATVKVPLMNLEAEFRYAEDELCQMIQLPYGEGEMQMVVLLPLERDGLATLEKGLTQKHLTRLQSGGSGKKVKLTLPRFKIESAAKWDKDNPMGMSRAFDPKKADFTGLSEVAKSDELHISQILHKAFIEVNEEGTKAAAATAVVITKAKGEKSGRVVFRADHPFIFLLQHPTSGAVLFMGRVERP